MATTRLRPMRKPEELAAVPPDKEVLVELPGDDEIEITEPSSGAAPAPAPKPAPPPEPEPEPGEQESALQKQLEDMKKAEALVRAQLTDERSRAEQARAMVRERDHELSRERERSYQSDYDKVLSDLAAAQAEADKAQGDLETALAGQDYKVAAEAQVRISRATNQFIDAERSKAFLESKREEFKAPARPEPQPQESQLPKVAQEWIEAHPEYKVGVKNSQIGYIHRLVVEQEGQSAFSPAYFESLETHLGLRKAPEPEPEPEAQPQRRSPPVSAPVSRSTPSATTGRATPSRVTLTPEQREAARISGVDEVTYARGVLELEKRKTQGMYPDR